MSAYEAGIFLLTLQHFYREIDVSDDVDEAIFFNLAHKASLDKSYKWLLTKASIDGIFPKELNEETTEITNQILYRYSRFINVRLAVDKSYTTFYNELKSSFNEKLYIFSTTSQVSNLTLEHIAECRHNIKELNFFLLSPLVYKDEALIGMSDEYDVPSYATPQQHQFIVDNHCLDMARRVLRIIMAVENVLAFKEQSYLNIKLYFYREKYPGVKIVLLDTKKYLQIKVGALKYANNLYRFGFEITNVDIVRKFSKAIQQYINDKNKIQNIPLVATQFERLKKIAFRQIAFYLKKQGVDIDEIRQNSERFKILLKNNKTEQYLNEIVSNIDKIKNKT